MTKVTRQITEGTGAAVHFRSAGSSGDSQVVVLGTDGSDTTVVPPGWLGAVSQVTYTTSGTPSTWTEMVASESNRLELMLQNNDDTVVDLTILGSGSEAVMFKVYPGGDILVLTNITSAIRFRSAAASKVLSGYKRLVS